MTTLAARIERASAGGGTITFLSGPGATGAPETVEWARLHEEARGAAARLQARGVGPGSHVAVLGPTSRPLVTALQGVWLSGATVMALPLPMRLGSLEEFVDQTRARIRAADAQIVLMDPELAPFFEARASDPPVVELSELEAGAGRASAAAWERPEADPDALAILQFTSGSTADPKGVMLPHAQVLANLDAIVAAARVQPGTDVAVSWLPLYHDMGLIGMLLTPMTTGTDLVLAGPQDFMAAPARWMEWMDAFGGTLTAGPNFSYALAARALRRSGRLDLSRWRLALNGAEPIDPSAVEAFLDAGARHGLRGNSALCVFGMAEATLAVTFPEPGSGMSTDTVDRRVLEVDRYAAPQEGPAPARSGKGPGSGTRRLARLGRPVGDLQIRIVDPETGSAMAEREVGELEIRGSSMTPGYYRRPEETERSHHDGWLRTGDLGYLVEGELVVCGRMKDVIIVGGRNVFPEDVERAAADVEGVRAGNVIAFGIDGPRGESLVVVAEARAGGGADLSGGLVGSDGPSKPSGALRDEVARRVRQAVGLPPRDVVLVHPGTLPKTSSGKLQRSLCRTRYLGDDLPIV
ncbi:MAG: AMP-binding protein [Acidimicrobiales bacterium]